MDTVIKNLRRTYEHLTGNQRLTANDVKYSIVCNVLLKELGYDAMDFDFDGKADENRYDMAVKISAEEKLLIKTKSIYTKLTSAYIDALVDDIECFGTEWGLLTNGRDYILLNSSIEPQKSKDDDAPSPSVVFWFDIYKSKDKSKNSLKYFRYLDKENIFATQKTKFFRDIAQYRAWLGEKSSQDNWPAVKNTLYQFFDFYADSTKQYNGLGEINSDDFTRFIAYKQDAKSSLRPIRSKESIHNNFSHIFGMLSAYKKKKKMDLSFSYPHEEVLVVSTPKKKEDISHLNAENILKIIDIYKSRDNALRNTTIFLLCVSFGLDRKGIKELKWRDIDLKKNTATTGGRVIKLNKTLSQYLNELKLEQTKEQAETGYVFTAFHKGKYKPVSEATINDVFDRLYEYDKNDIWELFSPAYVRRGLIEQLFRCNYSLDEIMYLTGLKVGSITKYITMERIILRQATNTSSKRLPLFDGVLDKE